jgi:carboxyl-terminal processing protease
MMPAANQGVGMNMGFPDVCLTPMAPAPIPVPYPNIGMNAMAMPFVPNVLLSMAPAQSMAAKPLMTNGDNAGVAHPLCMQPGGTTMGNPRILIGGMPAAHLCVPTYGNNFNNPLGSKLVPSVTNVLLGFASSDARALWHERASARRVRDGALALRLPRLGLHTASWLRATLRAHAATGPRPQGLVLDLRGNPGGSLGTAAAIARHLLGCDRPLVVLVDGSTASAAEWLAAALRERGGERVRLAGERTFGKGRAQWFTSSPDDLACKAPAQPLRTVGGARIDDRGVAPDRPLPPHDDPWSAHGERA